MGGTGTRAYDRLAGAGAGDEELIIEDSTTELPAAARRDAGISVWLTGLPAAGKSTVARLVHERLTSRGRAACVLDGDDLRRGLNSDLGFSMDDRTENLRRTAHVAQLVASAGVVVLVATISPLRTHRAFARRVHADAGVDLLEVYVATPLAVCERRDPRGL